MKVDLPGDAWAIIRSRDEITERQNRAIARASLLSTGKVADLESLGFKDDDPTTYGFFNDLSEAEKDQIAGVQTALILAFVASWSFDSDVSEESCLDLPTAVYQTLAMKCLTEYRGGEDGPLASENGSRE